MQALHRVSQFRFFRFLISGGLNTTVTYGIYLVLLQSLSYRISYTVAYAVGILMAYVLNRSFVFRNHQGLRTLLLLPFVYLVQYGVSLLVLWLWIDIATLNAKLGPLVVIAITVPVTYWLSKISFIEKQCR